MSASLVGSEMCIRDRKSPVQTLSVLMLLYVRARIITPKPVQTLIVQMLLYVLVRILVPSPMETLI
eukprot:9040546-Alexandrium_andersonii.AAC.1